MKWIISGYNCAVDFSDIERLFTAKPETAKEWNVYAKPRGHGSPYKLVLVRDETHGMQMIAAILTTLSKEGNQVVDLRGKGKSKTSGDAE